MVLSKFQWEDATKKCCGVGMKLLSIEYDYKSAGLQAAIACTVYVYTYSN